LSSEKGAFPLFDRAKYLQGETVAGLDAELRALINAHGVRNALLTSIAPTGTISLLAENVSSGIEPVFAYTYKRRITKADGTQSEEVVEDYAHRLFRQLRGNEASTSAKASVDQDENTTRRSFSEGGLPDYFVNAQELSPDSHIAVQAAAQKYVDSSISKTVNCPADISFDAFKDVYLNAYESGCKGCTTWRPNDITGSILSVEEPSKTRAAPAGGAARHDLQGALAGERSRDLHYTQRHRRRRAPASVRDFHQLQEHGALRLDRRADAHDLGRVPARRGRVVRGRGAESRVRPAGRAMG
jgi:ribonucleoside-diphosphate reductase alpha chain